MVTDLKVELFPGFILSGPIWIASSHLTGNVPAIGHWTKYSPAALTLKTTSFQHGGEGVGQARIYRRFKNSPSFFTDGPKNLELLSGETTLRLYDKTRLLLPDTLIGPSALQGENYGELRDLLPSIDFVELNTKYSARLGNIDSSFVDYQRDAHIQLLEEVRKFSDAFGDTPQFIKLTREFPWLVPCEEWDTFVSLILQLRSEGRNIGLILANTPRSLVPASMVRDTPQERGIELSGGVITGDVLFIKTYDLIRNLYRNSAGLDNIPIVATGGIMTLPQVVDMFYAGASTVQLCTAFHEYKPSYHAWLLGQLSRIVSDTQSRDMLGFYRFLSTANETELARIRNTADKLGIDFSSFISQEFDNQHDIIEETLVREVKITPDRSTDMLDRLSGYRTSTQPGGLFGTSEKSPVRLPLEILSVLSSPLTHGTLSMIHMGVEVGESNLRTFEVSSDVVREMINTDWDIAVISSIHAQALVTSAVKEGLEFFDLGLVAAGEYKLMCSTDTLDEVEEIFHFGGLRGIEVRDRLFAEHPLLASGRVSSISPENLARLMQQPLRPFGVLAKDPMVKLFWDLMPNTYPPFELWSGQVAYHMVVSRRFTERESGDEGHDAVGQALSVIDQARVDSKKMATALLGSDYVGGLRVYFTSEA